MMESCLASLTKLQKPFKYIVNCVIMQVNSQALLSLVESFIVMEYFHRTIKISERQEGGILCLA